MKPSERIKEAFDLGELEALRRGETIEQNFYARPEKFAAVIGTLREISEILDEFDGRLSQLVSLNKQEGE